MFARHELLWLGEEGWRQFAAGAPASVEAADAIARWRAADWPLIVRRADADLDPGQVSLGLALPPRAEDGRKLRIAGRVAIEAVRAHQAPLPLAQVVAALPRWPAAPAALPCLQNAPAPLPCLQDRPAALSGWTEAPAALPCWQDALAALARDAKARGLDVRVYGSAALQTLTGQAYLRPASDIDLLLQARSGRELDAALALLRAHAAGLPLDGEIVFPGGRAVAWKELAGALGGAAGSRVLVKEMTRVSLVKTGELLAALEEAPCLN